MKIESNKSIEPADVVKVVKGVKKKSKKRVIALSVTEEIIFYLNNTYPINVNKSAYINKLINEDMQKNKVVY